MPLYVPTPVRPAALSRLTPPIYVAHRCNTSITPENTLEAAAQAVALGADMLDFDANLLADGTLGIMHDDTVDRTTTGTGQVSAFTAPQWANLVTDAGAWFTSAWGNLKTPTVADVLRTFGGQVAISVEAKTTSCVAPLINLIQKFKLDDSVLINTQILADVATIKAAGIHANYWFPNPATVLADLPSAVAAAPDSVQVHYLASDAAVTAVAAAFERTYGYTVTRRYDGDRLLALGCSGLYCDDAPYLSRKVPVRTRDSWATKTYGYGCSGNYAVTDRPTFVDTNEFQFAHAGGIEHVVVGEVSPLANQTAWTIDLDVKMVTAPADASRFFLLQVNLTDRVYPGSSVENGYNCLVRANGQMGLFRNAPGGSSVGLATKTTGVSAWTPGTTHHYRFACAGNDLTFTDTTTGFSLTAADTSYRNVGYIHIGKSSTDGVWTASNLVIT